MAGTLDLDPITAHARAGGREGAAGRGLGAAVPGRSRGRVQAPRRPTGADAPDAARRAPVPARVGTRRLAWRCAPADPAAADAYLARTGGSRPATGRTCSTCSSTRGAPTLAAGRTSLMVAADAADRRRPQRPRPRRPRRRRPGRRGRGVGSRTGPPSGSATSSSPGTTSAPSRPRAGGSRTATTGSSPPSTTTGRCASSAPAGAGPRPVLPADYVREHVELGYATTAHRAQGRTVDTAHAYVSAATVRGTALRDGHPRPRVQPALRRHQLRPRHRHLTRAPATRSRSTRCSSRCSPRPAPSISATQTRNHEPAAASSPARLEAEGAAIQHHRRQQRYTDLLLASGVPPEHIQAAKTADRWRPLLERMRRAELLGLDLEGVLAVLPPMAPLRSLAHFEARMRVWCELREDSARSPNRSGNGRSPRPGTWTTTWARAVKRWMPPPGMSRATRANRASAAGFELLARHPYMDRGGPAPTD